MDEQERLIENSRHRRELPSPELRRQIRKLGRVTQAEIAQVLGINRASVSRWESGERTPRGKLAKSYKQLLERIHAEALK